MLKKLLPAGMAFPYDFGFLPGTKGEDGDPLDVIVISEFPTFPGCSVECRIIGAFVISQTESAQSSKSIRNDRFIAIPVESEIYSKVDTIKDLPKQIVTELEAFFINYMQLEGKRITVERRISASQSTKLIQKCKDIGTKKLLFEIFVPLHNQDGKSFPDSHFDKLRDLLLDKFGGVTVYHRSPVKGIWHGHNDSAEEDKLIIFEVMTVTAEKEFWNTLKSDLEKRFQQDEILIRVSRISMV